MIASVLIVPTAFYRLPALFFTSQSALAGWELPTSIPTSPVVNLGA
jgi:hypothetical protein